MDETVDEMCGIGSAFSAIPVRQTKTTITECKVCGDSSRYSYYGAIVCQSCKVFFKRNVQVQQEYLKCYFNDDCDINVDTRRTCSTCRLKKCFTSGMCADMIRSCRVKRNEDKQLITGSIKSRRILVSRKNQNQPGQIPISSLIRSDQSTLSTGQWNLLSNLVHCFDEYSGYSFVEHYIHEQNRLPVKSRYKSSSAKPFLTSLMGIVQFGFEKNRDFLFLSSNDRTVLLRNTVQYTTSIGAIFLLRQHHLMNNPSFYNSAELMFRPIATAAFRCITDQLDSDDTFIKLFLVINAFSTTNYTVYTQSGPTSFIEVRSTLPIQNMYVDLLWRYLLQKYDHYETVIRFSNLIKCFISLHTAINEANESQQYIEMMNTVIEQTERTLHL